MVAERTIFDNIIVEIHEFVSVSESLMVNFVADQALEIFQNGNLINFILLQKT